MRVWTIIFLSISVATPALAQWDTRWNESGPAPSSCVFNGKPFFPGDEVCVRPGWKQICEPDGSLDTPIADSDCHAAESGKREGFGGTHPSTDVACKVDRVLF